MKYYRMDSDKYYNNLFFCVNDKWYCHSRIYKTISTSGVLNIRRYFIPVKISNSRRDLIEDFMFKKVLGL